MALPLRLCFQKLAISKCASPYIVKSLNASSDSANLVYNQQRSLRTRSNDSLQAEAADIRSRIPKSLSSFNVFMKENYAQAKKQGEGAVDIFNAVLKSYKSLSPNELHSYQEKAKKAKEAHKYALSKLTNDEKKLILFDKRKKLLKRHINVTRKQLEALKRNLKYPALPPSSFFLFCKDNAESVANKKSVVDRAKTLTVKWNALDDDTRNHYAEKSAELRDEVAREKTRWREKLSASEQGAQSLVKYDSLRSSLLSLKRKLAKLERVESLEEVAPTKKPARRRAVVRPRKKLAALKTKPRTKSVKKTTPKTKTPKSAAGKTKSRRK